MSDIYFLVFDGWDDVEEVFTDEDAALDLLARSPEEWYIKPVLDVNEFADHTIQTEDGAKAVIKRIENSLKSQKGENSG